MNFEDFLKSSRGKFASIYIDRLIPKRWRNHLEVLLLILLIASFSASVFSYDSIYDGIAILFFVLFCLFEMVQAFYNSSRFSDSPADHASSAIIVKSDDTDLTRGLLGSEAGQVLLFRLDIVSSEIQKFLSGERKMITDRSIKFESNRLKFSDYAGEIYKVDEAFRSFLSAHAVSGDEFEGAAAWISAELEKEVNRERWWSAENLQEVPSLGTALDFGAAYELSRYDKTLNTWNVDLENGYRDKEVEQLQNILSKVEGANAIIVDDDESAAKYIILKLLKRLQTGRINNYLEHKTIIELDWTSITSEKRSKAEMEGEILLLLRGAERAGNTIIYIANMPAFMSSMNKLGVNLSSLLEQFLSSPELNIIAHSTKADFHYFIEVNNALTQMFERLIPDEAGVEASMPALLETLRLLETKTKVFFSYPAVLQVAESAEKYLTYGEMPGKAVDLLTEIAGWARQNDIKFVEKTHVSSFVSAKTGIQSGVPVGEEMERLNNLEQVLHRRIVGEDEAVRAIASAMRRARSGINNPKRPFASFLFLGPTGVGKTETSKVLAESFFGAKELGSDKIIRFDMSEYKEADALPMLLGSFSEGKSGLLASKIRDNPYGVLLLDEFEKASPDVLNLFLSVLDEGEFADALGSKVNARNLIIIATSNAGSDLIWKMVEEGKDLNQNKQIIINKIIKDKIYKPELINRFDGVIIFHPLKEEQLEQVGKMMFQKLANRIKEEKQIQLVMAPSLLDYLVENSAADHEFGARSINRLLQDKVEDFIAKKILSGEVVPGSVLEITKEDVI